MKRDDTNLRIPGPTPCPDEVLEAMSRPMMNYRGPQMKALVTGLRDKLARYLETDYEIVLLTASGTGAMEASVANLLGPGGRVLAVVAGVFGKRFASIAEVYGCDVRTLPFEWGRAAEPEALREALRSEKNVACVLLTQNETSTGVAHPIEELARVVHEESDALVVVDAISSLGAMRLPMKSWGVDLVLTGSQKAWGVPPGMSLLFLGPRAIEGLERASLPRFYFDLRRYLASNDKGTFPFTPAVSLVYALDVALDAMLRETAAGVAARHERVAEVARAGVRSLGLELLADERHLSPTVTAVRLPKELNEAALVEILRTKHGTIVARGQERLQGEILRIGHLGFVQEPEIRRAIDALGKALSELGASV